MNSLPIRFVSFCKKIDQHLLFILSLILVVFIPLFPKIPLFDALPGYIVKIRIEDFLVGLTLVVWMRDVVRKKAQWNTSFFWFVIAYACSGILSIILATTLTATVPVEVLHIGKSGLHYFRYLEYFLLFFFVTSAIRHKIHTYILFAAMVVTLIGVVGYGMGQKYARFPVYSTMNREYSKGEKLYLQEGARPQSTFAGHYDLAAYLVIVLPLLFSVGIGFIISPGKKRVQQYVVAGIIFVSHAAGFFMLVLSGSKIALLGYLIGMGVVAILHLYRIQNVRIRFLWAGTFTAGAIVGAVILWFILPDQTRKNVLSLFHKPAQQGQVTPVDLIGDGYEMKRVATKSADGTTTYIDVRTKSTWSPNAIKYGLSMGIRLDTLWPQALLGFARNPLTGSGYGVLSSLDSHAFSEADSTDNNFLRTLGETGIIGFITFYGVIFFILYRAKLQITSTDKLGSFSAIGIIGATVGLLITAIYLDIFAASKVAFTFYAAAGLALQSGRGAQTDVGNRKESDALKKFLQKHAWIIGTLIFSFVLLHQNPFLYASPVKDIQDATGGLQEITSARCFIKTNSFSLCRNSDLPGMTHISPVAILLVPWLSIFTTVSVFYYLTVLIILLSIFATYKFFVNSISGRMLAISVMSGVVLITALNIHTKPLTTITLIFICALFPTLVLMYTNISRFQNKIAKRFIGSILALFFVAQSIYSLTGNRLFDRFRSQVQNASIRAVELMNSYAHPTNSAKAYVISALNPYFIDLYTTNVFTPIPLSPDQAYGKQLERVWGLPDGNVVDLYKNIVSKKDLLFVSDYGTYANPEYSKRFQSLKQTYMLQYIVLGCNEQCNLYAVQEENGAPSPSVVSPFTSFTYPNATRSAIRRFAFIPNRYDYQENVLGPPYYTSDFASRMYTNIDSKQDVVFITGDAIHWQEQRYGDQLTSAYVNKMPYPVLYVSGNETHMPKKQYAGEFGYFFSGSNFFVMLPATTDSTMTNAQHIALYNALLVLEKHPEIQNLFIISYNLNWQIDTSTLTATDIIRRKIAEFPNIHTYVLTANHDPMFPTSDSWYYTKREENTNITFVAGLIANSAKDIYIQAEIGDNNSVTLTPKQFVH